MDVLLNRSDESVSGDSANGRETVGKRWSISQYLASHPLPYERPSRGIERNDTKILEVLVILDRSQDLTAAQGEACYIQGAEIDGYSKDINVML
jgi:hypothetical protein